MRTSKEKRDSNLLAMLKAIREKSKEPTKRTHIIHGGYENKKKIYIQSAFGLDNNISFSLLQRVGLVEEHKNSTYMWCAGVPDQEMVDRVLDKLRTEAKERKERKEATAKKEEKTVETVPDPRVEHIFADYTATTEDVDDEDLTTLELILLENKKTNKLLEVIAQQLLKKTV